MAHMVSPGWITYSRRAAGPLGSPAKASGPPEGVAPAPVASVAGGPGSRGSLRRLPAAALREAEPVCPPRRFPPPKAGSAAKKPGRVPLAGSASG